MVNFDETDPEVIAVIEELNIALLLTDVDVAIIVLVDLVCVKVLIVYGSKFALYKLDSKQAPRLLRCGFPANGFPDNSQATIAELSLTTTSVM